jgi:hypothetical protein
MHNKDLHICIRQVNTSKMIKANETCQIHRRHLTSFRKQNLKPHARFGLRMKNNTDTVIKETQSSALYNVMKSSLQLLLPRILQ